MANHAVEYGQLLHVSASQIKTFALCETRWYMEKVVRFILPEPDEKDPRTVGGNLHAQHEAYYEAGTEPASSSLQGLVHDSRWPDPGPHLLIEHPRDYKLGLKLAGVPVKGRADLVRWDDLTHPRIYDLKSMKTFDYAETSESLPRDIQMNIYGAWAFLTFSHARYVTYSHGQVLSQASDHDVVDTEPLTKPHVDRVMASIEGLVERMRLAAAAPSAEYVSYDVTGKACTKYGREGCPYKSACPHFTDMQMDFTMPPEEGAVSMSQDEIRAKLSARIRAQHPAIGINPPDAAKPLIPTSIEPPPVIAQALSDSPDATSSTGSGLYLYVDCAPVKGPHGHVTRLEELIHVRAKPITTKHKVSDVREVKFGEGTAALTADFIRNPPSGTIVATSGGLSTSVIEVLIPLASVVVRGV